MTTTDTSFKVKNNLIVLGTLTSSFSANVSVTGTITATSFSGSGALVTSLHANNLTTGTVNTARLGSGTANTSTFLRGDNTWATVPTSTNLGYSANSINVVVTSDTGTDIVILGANSTVSGVMSATDKSKLDGIASGAQVNVPTNLTLSSNATTVTVLSDTGTDAIVLAANSTVAGVLTAADKSKLDGIASGAQVNVPTNLSLSSNATHVNVNSDTGTDVSIPTANSTVAGTTTAADYTRLVNTSGTNTGDQTTITGNAGSATVLQTARNINGTSFNGSANITTASWGTSRTITIGSTGKAVDGSAAVTWTLAEIGAAPNTHVATGGAAHLSANSTANGFMTSTDFTKLAGIASGAQVNVPTNLTYSANATTASVFSDTGTDVVILAANTTVSGVMAAADYSRLASTSGTNTGDQTTITGNAGTATTLQTARTIAISGPITGTATSFNGSANITIPVTAVDLTSATLSGVIGTDHLGTGTANTTTWLRGDGSWQTIASGATNLTHSANATHVTIISDTGTDTAVPAANSTVAGILSAADYAYFAAGGGGSGATNLTLSSNSISVTVLSDTGSDAIIPAANSTIAGVFTASDKNKLDGIASGAQVNVPTNLTTSANDTHVSVFSDTGTDAHITAANTSQAGVMSLSVYNRLLNTSGTNTGDQTSVTGNAGTATTLQTARNINGTSFNGSANITTALWGTARTISIGATGKSVDGSANVAWSLAEIGAASNTHTHVIGDVTGLQTALDAKAPLVSPPLTGTPTTPTAATATNDTTIASTAFVVARIANDAPSKTGSGASGTWGISITGSAASASAAPWSGITGTPTTLAGYNISDAAPLSHVGSGGGSHAAANTTTNGYMTSSDFNKLAGIASGAQVNVPTNLTYSANATTTSIFSDTGTDVIILAANSTVAGVMSAADNARLASTSGTNTGDQTTITGNAGTATTLQTARTIAMSGVATGSATSFNGSANITIPVTALDLGSANNTGTVATARLGSGTANSTTYLAGDSTWKTVTSGGSGLTWVTVSSASVASANNNYGYVMETGGTARTVTLPASVAQGFYIVVNASGANVTIVSNGNVIDEVGSGNDLLLENGDTVALIGKATGQIEILYGRGTVDLTLTSNATNMTIVADTGTDVVLTSASGSLAGVMTAADKTKLDGIASGAQVNVPTNLTLSSNATTVTVLSDTGTDAIVLAANSTVAGVMAAADYTRLVNTSGTNTGDQTTITGNAGSATVLQTARTIAISGAITGTATSFNGSANITIPVTTVDLTSTSLSGIIGTDHLGSGTANSTTYLAGDSTWKTISAGGANLTLSSNATTVTVLSDTGTDAVVLSANSTVAGVMAAADYSRLVNTSGTNTGDQTTITGNAGTATTLQTARTIALTGIVTGTATSFNGSANISIPVTAVDLGNANNTGTVAVARGGSGVGTSTGSNNLVLSHSPTFTGTPLATTAAAGTKTTQIATTEFAQSTRNPRVQSVAATTSFTSDISIEDMGVMSALTAGVTINNPTGTPVEGQKLMYRVKDNGTARSIAFGADFRGVIATLPTTTVISKWTYMGFSYNSTDSKWDMIAYGVQV